VAKVVFIDQGIEVEVPVGTSILEAARLGGAPQGDACGGQCACSTCHVYVERGADVLTEPEEDEEDGLDKAFDVRESSRLGCQARIEREGDVAVRISAESVTAYHNEHPDDPRASGQ
jgi:ferredoxin